MESIYRTLCFCEKVNDEYIFFYGHSILWNLTPLDYVVEGWKRKNIGGDMYVFFSDLPNKDLIDQLLNERKIEIETNGKKHNLVFKWNKKDTGFLINDSNEDEYKPFISLCTDVTYYFSEIDDEFVDDFLQKRKTLISKIETDFFVPLAKNPHLIFTFSVYIPTRIEAFLKNIRDENNHITGVNFVINDVFNDYQSCEVNFLLTSDGEKEDGSFKLCNIPENINTNFDPDYMELTIKDGEKVVFTEKCYFIKSININMNIISGSIKTNNGSISMHRSSSFTVGDKDE